MGLSENRQPHLLGVENIHELFAGNGFFVIEEVSQFIQFRTILDQNLKGFLMLLFHQFNDLVVNLSLSFSRTCQRCITPRYWLVTVSRATMSKSSFIP